MSNATVRKCYNGTIRLFISLAVAVYVMLIPHISKLEAWIGCQRLIGLWFHVIPAVDYWVIRQYGGYCIGDKTFHGPPHLSPISCLWGGQTSWTTAGDFLLCAARGPTSRVGWLVRLQRRCGGTGGLKRKNLPCWRWFVVQSGSFTFVQFTEVLGKLEYTDDDT